MGYYKTIKDAINAITVYINIISNTVQDLTIDVHVRDFKVETTKYNQDYYDTRYLS